MRGKRMLQTLRLCTILDAGKRTKYYKDKKIFYSMGNNCVIMDRKVPLYPKLISIGNNVHIASNVCFITHDITHLMLNRMPGVLKKRDGKKLPEKTGCIEIGDNVFIGTGTTINYDVRIGSNVIIGVGSVVTKDIPDNCVVAGVSARMICSFDEYLEKRLSDTVSSAGSANESIDENSIEECWKAFRRKHN